MSGESETQFPQVAGLDLTRALVNLFGLEQQRVRALTLHVELNKPVTLTVERFLTKPEGDEICRIIEEGVGER